MSKILTQKIESHHTHEHKSVFAEFLSSNHEESASPFLTLDSRKWAKNLSLKTSIFTLVLLAIAITLNFIESTKPLSLLVQVVIFFFAGIPALLEAIEKLKKFQVNIDVLMVLAAFLSLFIHSSLEGSLLLVLFSLSHSLEHYVSDKAKSTLTDLSHRVPSLAQVVLSSGKVIEKSVKDVQVGDLIWVRAGEVVPLDGKILEGRSSLDVSHLTGEHIPIVSEEGQEAPAGAINLEAALKLQVTRTNNHSTLTKIVQLIDQANSTKPKLQSWFDRFGQRYSLFVILSSFAVAIVLPLLFHQITYFGVEGSIYRALAYFIAASPCALIMAVPIAYISAINASAKQGAILKGGIILDTLSKVRSIAFDKTGTLTSGELECLSITELDGLVVEDPHTLLSIARGLEQHAVHPIAKAIIHYADFRGIASASIKNGKALPGQGICGEVIFENQSQFVAIGHIAYIASLFEGETKEKLLHFKNDRAHLVSALKVGEKVYLFHFVDHLRPDAPRILKLLKEKLKLKTYILSGDNELSVERIAKNLTVDHYFGHLRPEDKLALVEKYSQEENLAMVGDGVNDTPALARAAVGISLGNIGSHMGSEASDVVLIKNDLSLIYKLFMRAKKTLRIVKQNVTLAALIILCISVPALFGWIPLWLAVICHEGGTVLVGLNSLRLLKS